MRRRHLEGSVKSDLARPWSWSSLFVQSARWTIERASKALEAMDHSHQCERNESRGNERMAKGRLGQVSGYIRGAHALLDCITRTVHLSSQHPRSETCPTTIRPALETPTIHWSGKVMSLETRTKVSVSCPHEHSSKPISNAPSLTSRIRFRPASRRRHGTGNPHPPTMVPVHLPDPRFCYISFRRRPLISPKREAIQS